jgi:Ankyrin repeats (3 copies)
MRDRGDIIGGFFSSLLSAILASGLVYGVCPGARRTCPRTLKVKGIVITLWLGVSEQHRRIGMARAGRIVSIVLVFLSAAAARSQSSAPGDKAEALWEAARKGDATTVKKLLDEGVDVNTKYRYGATALSYACDRGNLEVVKVLLAHGADVNVEDTFYHATPLTWAASPAMGRKPQHAEIVGLLLDHGAKGKEDALMEAVSAPDVAMTKIILQHGGFPPDTLSNALETAKKDEHQDIVALLEQAGAKPYPEFKMDESQLERYAGTYRGTGATPAFLPGELVLAVKGGRLIGGPPGPQFTLAARDATAFRIIERPGATLTFRLEQDKVTSVTLSAGGNTTTYVRVEGK